MTHPASAVPPLRSIAEIRRSVGERRTSVSEEVEASLRSIELRNDTLKSLVRVDSESARGQARQVEARLAAGDALPLAGTTVAVKDNIEIAGMEARAGSRILAGRIADRDAVVVARLREAGAVIVGSANMHEFALGGTSENPHFGDVVNPLDHAASPGGSSGGSATAVAAGLVTAALGTDTCGSVRMPASLTGTVGLRPTSGTVPLYGVVPLAPTMDTVGPMTRSVADNAALFAVLSRHTGSAVGDLPDRVLVPAVAGIAEDVARVFGSVVSALDGALEATALEDSGWIDESVEVATTTFLREAAEYHEGWLESRADEYGADVLAGLREGAGISAERYRSASRRRFELSLRARRAIGARSVLLLPVFGFTWLPSHVDEVETAPGTLVDLDTALLRFISAAPVTGLPALTIPAGSDHAGHPIGVQLIGAPGSERHVYALAALLEATLG